MKQFIYQVQFKQLKDKTSFGNMYYPIQKQMMLQIQKFFPSIIGKQSNNQILSLLRNQYHTLYNLKINTFQIISITLNSKKSSKFINNMLQQLISKHGKKFTKTIGIQSNLQQLQFQNSKVFKQYEKDLIKFNIHQQIFSQLEEWLYNPNLPKCILSSETIKATSWFQMQISTQGVSFHQNNKYFQLLEFAFEKISESINEESIFNSQNTMNTLISLRFVIIKNCEKMKHLEKANFHNFLQIGTWIYHMISNYCYFIRTFLLQIRNPQHYCHFLNFYVIFWKQFQGSIFHWQNILQPYVTIINSKFDQHFKMLTEIPQMTVEGLMSRIWGQIIISNINTKENEQNILMKHFYEAYEQLLFYRRKIIFDKWTALKQNDEKKIKRSSKNVYIEQFEGYEIQESFFKNISELESLLQKFFTAFLDISSNEYSVHWLGYTQTPVFFPFQHIYNIIANQTYEFYNHSNLIFTSDFKLFKNYIQEDIDLMSKITDHWIISKSIKPIAMNYLQENLRQQIVKQVNVMDDFEEGQQLCESINYQEEKLVELLQKSSNFNLEEYILKQQLQKLADPLENAVIMLLNEGNINRKINENHKQSDLFGSSVSSSRKVSNISTLPSSGLFLSQSQSIKKSHLNEKKTKGIMKELQETWIAYEFQQLKIWDAQNMIESDQRNSNIEKRNGDLGIKLEISDQSIQFYDICKVNQLRDVKQLLKRRSQLNQTLPKNLTKKPFQSLNSLEKQSSLAANITNLMEKQAK